jgi:hypothetical protein
VAADDEGRNTSDDISSLLSVSTDEPSFAPTDEPIALRTRFQLMVLSDMVCFLLQVNHIHLQKHLVIQTGIKLWKRNIMR